jgi:hypothetical protein
MTTELLDAPLTTDTPPDENQHHFRKVDLDKNLFDGVPITALCGFVKEGLARPDTEQPVCDSCHHIMETIVGTGPGAK